MLSPSGVPTVTYTDTQDFIRPSTPEFHGLQAHSFT